MTKANQKSAIRARSFGALSLVGVLLFASAALRLAVGATTAVAKEEPLRDPPAVGTQTVAEAGVAVLSEAEIGPVLKALNAREARIAEREEALVVRQKALEVAEERIEEKLKALETAEESLKATLSLARTAAEDDITRLTSVYANMKPKQAAALFEEMDPEFAAGFLGRMRPDAAAAIMAGLSPQAAYTISVILAGRNANAPKE